MDYSTISNKTNCTEVEEVTDGEITERYYLLKKQFNSLSTAYEAMKQELHDTRRSNQTALDVQEHLTVELEKHQADEARRRSELTSRIATLQEEITSLRQERTEVSERYANEISGLRDEIRCLKGNASNNVAIPTESTVDTTELDELRSELVKAASEAALLKESLELLRDELGSWQHKAETLTVEMEQVRESANMRREDLKAANEREAAALAELAEARALLHQCTNQEDQPHAAKGNSLFAEVEDKRQEMAKTLIQMKQTNSKLRREVANKQAELDALHHEKLTVWEQQLGAAAHTDRQLIESYEERVSELEAVTERQRRELARWFIKQCEATSHGWLQGVLQHLKSECDTLRAEVLSRGAAQLAAAAQIRELRRKLAASAAPGVQAREGVQAKEGVQAREGVQPRRGATPLDAAGDHVLSAPAQNKMATNMEDVRKRVTFN